MGQVKIRFISPGAGEYIYWTFKGKNLWEAIALCGLKPGGTCGGRGICGKCKVRIEGEVSPISNSEKEHLLPEEIRRGDRLACYCTINGPLTVYLDYSEFNLDLKETISSTTDEFGGPKQVCNRKILIPGLDKDSPNPIYTRLKEALAAHSLEIACTNLAELSLLDRAGRPSIELHALIFDNLVVKYIGKKPKRVYGVAVDLGSTSLFAALMDMENGQTVAVSSKNNMQRIYGADIISRVSYCIENSDGVEKLQNVLINNINLMIQEMVKEANASFDNIYQFSVVGNPVMVHLFLGLNPKGFAAAPYSGIFADELVVRAGEVGLYANPDARVIIPPQIGGFVGADTIACLLTIADYKSSRFLLIDIGTNGEIILGNRGRMWAASAAAGPAFEGGSITSGARAGNGIIDKVSINEDGKLEFNILGDKPVKGICGSGLIDLCACMLKAGFMDNNGIISQLANDVLEVRQGLRGPEIILLQDGNTLKGSPIVFNQEDIRQIQLAKAAVRTAVDILLKEAQLDFSDLDKIYLAGAFGNYLNPEHSMTIGLIPPVVKDRIVNIGNAAGQGAIIALLSPVKRNEAKILKDKVEYIELANRPDFEEMYINNLNFSCSL